VSKLAFLSPYVEDVSSTLRGALAERGVDSPVFGSFDEAEETRVARIDGPSVIAAAKHLAGAGGVDAVFLSCTNLRSFGIIDQIEAETGLPVLSSNLVLGWHMFQLAGARTSGPGRLFAA
jgi:maleate isomerase